MNDAVSKFVKRDETSEMFESLLAKNNGLCSFLLYTSSFDPSHVTECPRRMMYRSSGLAVDPNPELYAETMSQLFTKKKWIDILSKMKAVKMVDKDVVSADCHYNLSGNIDVILNIDDKIYVTKIQSVSQEEFNQIISRGALKKHVIETMIYIWLTETNDGLLLYDNRNSNQYRVFHIKAYAPIIKSVMKKCMGLIEYKMQGRLPNRPYDSRSSDECMKCEYITQCWRLQNEKKV